MGPPRCFISYSWDSEQHQEWVRKLATQLRERGVDAILDQFHCPLGTDLTQFMERSVTESSFVLLICTPTFAQKADAGVGGVGYEKTIVTGEIFTGKARETKFVPLLREGDVRESLPRYLMSRLFIDFRDDSSFETKLEELLRHFHGEPRYPLPFIGPKPDLKKPTSVPVLVIRQNFRVQMTEVMALYYKNTQKDATAGLIVPEGLSVLSSGNLMPDHPLPIKELDSRLRWKNDNRQDIRNVPQFDLASIMKNFDKDKKLYNGFLYRYIGGDINSLEFCRGGYFEFLNTCECLSYELAEVFTKNAHLLDKLKTGGRSEFEKIARFLESNENLIPLRKKAKPFDFAARSTAFGTCAFVLLKRSKKPARFILNLRSYVLSETPGLLHVIPAGTFQPNADDDRFHEEEFSFSENIIREFTEELLEDRLLRSDAPSVHDFIDMYPEKGKLFRKKIIEPGNFEVLYLGTIVDPINLKPEIITVFLMHEAYLKLISGEKLEPSYETQSDKLKFYDFTKNEIARLLNEANLVPTGKAHLSMILKHYDCLDSKIQDL